MTQIFALAYPRADGKVPGPEKIVCCGCEELSHGAALDVFLTIEDAETARVATDPELAIYKGTIELEARC